MSRRFSRRQFVRNSLATFSLAATFAAFLDRAAGNASASEIKGFGPLRPVADETTGLPLLMLPDGFRYSSFGWTGDIMQGGFKTPPGHDGMGVIASEANVFTLCRNHELKLWNEPFAPRRCATTPKPAEAVPTSSSTGKPASGFALGQALAGTSRNCAGGSTPWGTWLSCEETVLGPGDIEADILYDYQQDHGYIFEVAATAGRDGDTTLRPTPLKAMGRFVHEAIAVDPKPATSTKPKTGIPRAFTAFRPEKTASFPRGATCKCSKPAALKTCAKAARLGKPTTCRGSISKILRARIRRA